MSNARTAHLFERYYFSRPSFISGAARFHNLIGQNISPLQSILEIGAGPSNDTSDYIAGIGGVTGLDISSEVLSNRSLKDAKVFDGGRFPFPDCSFDSCVSSYVLEHVTDCEIHFREIARVLRPGGNYIFRTPNLWHYVTLGSHLTPHWVHLRFANWLRGIEGAHDPWPTVYRANTRRAIMRHAQKAGLCVSHCRTIEYEPWYGAVSPVLFFPMMAYERLVNSTRIFSVFRSNIIGVLRKPA